MLKNPAFFALAAILSALALLNGCGAQQPPSHASHPGLLDSPQGGAGAKLFTPLNDYGAFAVPDEEALRLASSLSPSAQGLGGWKDLRFALEQSLAFAKARPAGDCALERPGLRLTWATMTKGLERLIYLLPYLDSNPSLLVEEFRWLRLGPDFSFTGYYEPTLRASRVKTKEYNYPLYRLPPDVKNGKPYYSRNAIDRKGALNGRKLEIAWVDSETDAFFLHVQGSGRLAFPDGSTRHVLYAGKNNQAYKSLGRLMKEQGLLPEDNVNMRSIRAWLSANPERRAELFDQNPSYVFFKEATAGPIGGMGRQLTPKVSLAVDRRVIPHGAILFFSVPMPDSKGLHSIPFHGLGLPQDTGGAIKGNRVDFFCGAGPEAAHTAGYLDAPGAVYILIPAK